jgi:histone H4
MAIEGIILHPGKKDLMQAGSDTDNKPAAGASSRSSLSVKRRQGFKTTKRGGEHIGIPSIKRLARKGGVKRLGGGVYQETRFCLEQYLTRILKDLVMLVEHADRFTVTVMDVVFALKRNGQALYGYGDVFPQSRGQRISQLRKKKITFKQEQQEQQVGGGGVEEEEDERILSLDDSVVQVVQKTLADYFVRERADICRVQTLLKEVNGQLAAEEEQGGRRMNEATLHLLLKTFQSQNLVFINKDDIYLI